MGNGCGQMDGGGNGLLRTSKSGNSPVIMLLVNGGNKTGRSIWRERTATSTEKMMAQWRNSPTILVHEEEQIQQEMMNSRKDKASENVKEEEMGEGDGRGNAVEIEKVGIWHIKGRQG
jgi:hypothetical protein